MRRRAIALLVPALLLVAAGSAAADGRDDDGEHRAAVYLALGDSVAAGVGADQGDGYVDELHEELTDDKNIDLVNVSQPGATSKTLIAEQLPAAVDLLATRDVRVITITIGGNDVFRPVTAACIPVQGPGCAATIQTTLTEYAANLATILARLRAAAGPDTTIVTTAYDNPLPACFLAGFAPLGDAVLEGGHLVPLGLNDITRVVSAAFGAAVADAFGELDEDEFVGGQDCLHPNEDGHEELAEVFEDTIEDAAD